VDSRASTRTGMPGDVARGDIASRRARRPVMPRIDAVRADTGRTDWMTAASGNPDRRSARRARRGRPSRRGCSRSRPSSSGRDACRTADRPSGSGSRGATARRFPVDTAGSAGGPRPAAGRARCCARSSRRCRRWHWRWTVKRYVCGFVGVEAVERDVGGGAQQRAELERPVHVEKHDLAAVVGQERVERRQDRRRADGEID
jgi:hypothetical protein